MIYLRARYYAPWQGRFITTDPFPGIYNQPATLHPYLYGVNNPVRYTDPSGHCIFGIDTLVCIAIAGVLGGVLGGMAYHGYEVLTSEDPCARWDWNRALLWSGVGGAIGAPLALGVGYVGINYLGWWGATKAAGAAGSAATAACADGDCTNEISAVTKATEIFRSQGGYFSQAAQNAWEQAVRNGRQITILGSGDSYKKLAQILDANYLNMPTSFNWGQNIKFVWNAINRGNLILTATDPSLIRAGSYFARELRWLSNVGYKFVDGILTKIP